MFSFSKRFLIVFILSLFFCAPTFASTIARPMSNSGLVGYWNFEEGKGNAYVYDRSGYGKNGTFVNGPVSTSSNTGLGQALNFDGIDDYVSVGNQSNLDFPTNDFSMTTWVKPKGDGFIVSKFSNGSGQSYLLHVSGNTGRAFICDGVNCAITQGSINLVDGNWHFLAVTINRNGNVTLYVDSMVDGTPASTASVGNISGSPSVDFGDRSGGNGNYFSGKMDEVRIYNRALLVDEVSRLYKIQKPKVTGGVSNTGLVGYWPLDEGYGTKTRDTSFNSNDGNLNGGTWTNGKNGKAITFNGTSDFVDLGAPSSLNISSLNRFTLSAWVYPTSRPAGSGVITEMYSPTNTSVQYEIGFGMNEGGGGSSKLKVGFYASNAWYTSDDVADIPLNQWVHISGTWDGSTLTLYKNGLFVSSFVAGASLPSDNYDKVVIGKRHDAAGDIPFFPGKIDDARIYNRALSATEIYNLYKGSKASVVGKSKPERLSNGLVGYWTFDGNKVYGTTAYDSSSNGNNGTITNGPTVTIGKIGQALNFDGVDDQVVTSAFSSVPTSISLSAWIYPTAGGIVFEECDATGCGGWHDSQMEVMSTGEIKVGYWIGSLQTISLGTYSLNAWHHVVLTFDNSDNSGKGYVDGILRNSVTSDKQYPGTLYYSMGHGNSTNHGDGTYFNGKIDDARIYNRAISADEVKALYNTGK